MKRQDVYENIFGAGALFVTGLLIIPSLVFNPDTELRILQFIFFWFLAWLFGKKTNPLFTILIIACIVVFNLIIPYGRILFSFGMFKITSGALTAGIHRAVTLEALVMLSKFSVRQDLKIPGAFGELLCESLRIFSVIMSGKYRITYNNFIAEIDKMMLNLSEEELPVTFKEGQKTKPAGYVVLIIIIFLSWLPWLKITGIF